jgi:D-alanine-D-alanine ligase-like ATP-grasp enzyme
MQEAKKFEAEIANLISETMRLNAETMKIQAESKWYPFVVLAGVVGASIGIVKLFSS